MIPSGYRSDETRTRPGWLLLGPAFVAAIAYVDPGNVAANVSAGAQFGFLLVWVIVAANAMACLVQYLSAKLGLVSGMSLPEAVGSRMRRPTRLAYWLQAELVAMATDLAEVVGGAIALYLLFDLPLLVGGVITGVVSLLLLIIKDRRGQGMFERVITGLLAVIAVGFLASLVVSAPPVGEVAGGLVPRFAGTESVLIAAAMLGATVMPHAVYLHSALVRDRHGHPDAGPARRRLLRVTKWDVGIAMVIAGAVNLSMVLVAATNLQGRNLTESIEGAHAAVGDTLGSTVALLFAIGLLASGLASSSVGAYAGAMIMQGLLHKNIPLLVRRLVTLLPALVILAIGVDPSRALVLSQVVLSFGIPFALIPLIRLTGDRALMGEDTNHRVTTALGWLVAALISALNVVLIYLTVAG
ncbi:natural resistance-associated macrophage protein metal ion transporter NRAMP [Mycolicibacterium phlei]|uniref:Divalent metal cation transporter MntH n=1 Tax=Mycolicibacterium phlei DSM 43239 = CCUG 21000 TaxID=1226750 RepID=A0A5N5UYT4_MYCPH|nr:Nramp family divalent metal transporter [Mycolicibacterium phlei]VEG07836.1 natural resistance-associated macrophage protein metal ion transporter NRAMP [Mycobacteroides chelonae]AMO59708.1 Divalent metal cation transporter MntH [Mycolicibacterium phlei]KAB7753589.1 manganese transporter [Mycolicibacterium phlei DSM 43239 = CCUG 21000]KXW62492.1 manganese transporter [Mycolicibacterium phlei DSM 43239 = CCUG 21000]KXW69838.1 manganese transporter [Mycolicibacterium phlei DSM 43072]